MCPLWDSFNAGWAWSGPRSRGQWGEVLVVVPQLWCFLSDQATNGPPERPTNSIGGWPTSFTVRKPQVGECQSLASISPGRLLWRCPFYR